MWDRARDARGVRGVWAHGRLWVPWERAPIYCAVALFLDNRCAGFVNKLVGERGYEINLEVAQTRIDRRQDMKCNSRSLKAESSIWREHVPCATDRREKQIAVRLRPLFR